MYGGVKRRVLPSRTISQYALLPISWFSRLKSQNPLGLYDAKSSTRHVRDHYTFVVIGKIDRAMRDPKNVFGVEGEQMIATWSKIS